MSYTIGQIKSQLTAMGHGGTLNKVRDFEGMCERAAAKMLARCKPMETIRLSSLSSTVFDNVYNYALPSDFNSLIDLSPQDNRESWDQAFRNYAGRFDLEKAIKNKTISIEGRDGTRIIRINWRSNTPKTLNNMNSLTGNGTWSAVGTAGNLVADEIVKRSGTASLRFNVSATGDGIQNTTMTAVDLSDEDEVGDIIFDLYIKNATDLAAFTSITPVMGNDVSGNYWTFPAQTTQADGTAFQVGFNVIKAPWSSSTETGTVAPASIDSLKFTAAITSAITQLRIDNVRLAVGRPFEIKYYSKYLFKTPAGVYISVPSSNDDDVVVTIDNDSLPIYLYELLKEMSHQVEGTDSAFDMTYAQNELERLYPSFHSEHPDQRKQAVTSYGPKPRLRRNMRR